MKIVICLDPRTSGVFKLVADGLEHPVERIVERLLQYHASNSVSCHSLPSLIVEALPDAVEEWESSMPVGNEETVAKQPTADGKELNLNLSQTGNVYDSSSKI